MSLNIDPFATRSPAPRHRHASIRDHLEADAWKRHRRFAERRAARRPPEPRRPLRWQDRALLILSATLLLLLVIRVESAQAQQDSWGLEFRSGGARLRAVALDTDIDAEVNGLVARVTVSQWFENTGKQWAEAVYRYPLPDGSAVDRMVIEVGDRLLEGEIREKQDARRQYQQAAAAGQLASLVEQQRANQFETRLANIGPGDRVRVSISFLSRVDYRDGTFSLRLPMTFTPRWNHPEPVLLGGLYDESAPAPRVEALGGLDDHYLTLNIDLQPGVALASLESRYHDVDVHPTLGGYNVFLSNPDERSDRVFELNWTPAFGAAPEASMLSYDDGDAVYAMLMMTPPLAENLAPQPREVVFVVDTSGSMQGASMDQARAALRQGLGFLGEQDRFNLIRFDSDSTQLFDESVPAHTSYLLEAERFIDRLDADGGTDMAPALDMALTLPRHPGLLRQVVFITDGSVGNEGELLLQIAEQLAESRLFTVSIGSAPNDGFMSRAAEIGRGNHTHIARGQEVKEKMAGLWSRIQHPALQNICVDWGMEAEFYPSVVPDLYAGEPLWLLARLPSQPAGVSLCGELAGQPWRQETVLLAGNGSETLATMWAQSKVEALEESRLFGVSPETIRDEVTHLALAFGLLTPYTSMVAVDRVVSRPGNASMTPEAVPSLLPAGSTMNAAGFSRTAAGWLTQLLLSILSLLVVSGMLWFSSPPRRRRRPPVRSPMAGPVHSQ